WDQVKDVDSADPALIEKLDRTWRDVSRNASQILNGEDTVLDLHDVADTLAQTIPALQAEYEGVVELLLSNGSGCDQVAYAQRQSWLAERIVRSIARVLEGGDGSVVAADAFGRDAAMFARVLNGMIEGDTSLGIEQVTDPDALDYLAEIADLFDEFVNQSVDEILETAPELFQVRAAADAIFLRTQDLLSEATALNDEFDNSTAGVFPPVPGGQGFSLAALVMVGVMLFLRAKEGRSQRE